MDDFWRKIGVMLSQTAVGDMVQKCSTLGGEDLDMDIPEKDLKHFRDAREQLAEAVGKMQAAFKDKTISKALAQEIYDTARQILDAGASLVSGLAQTAVAAVKEEVAAPAPAPAAAEKKAAKKTTAKKATAKKADVKSEAKTEEAKSAAKKEAVKKAAPK